MLTNSVLTANKIQHFSTTETEWLMLIKEIIAAHSENHHKPINIICRQVAELLIIKAGGKIHLFTTGLERNTAQ
jgi:uracil DNA glycosylase